MSSKKGIQKRLEARGRRRTRFFLKHGLDPEALRWSKKRKHTAPKLRSSKYKAISVGVSSPEFYQRFVGYWPCPDQ